MRRGQFYVTVIGVVAFSGCKKPYAPPVTAINANYLVVEGFINTGADSTKILLSRTVLIDNKTASNPETKAIVTVENAQSPVATLTETIKGTYASAGLNLDNTKQYRLRIKTANGKTYLSDLADARVTPPIDSIGFTIQSNGLQIYVNSHDPKNNSRYYKYNFQEAWQFRAKYSSDFVSNGKAIIPRTQQIFFCFNNDNSAHTIINSTAALSQDVTYQFPITTIDATSEKIELKYSILVTQLALTKEAYTFYEGLQKNTEQLGSIFDAQPSQLIGNIHNIADPAEPVVGFISAGISQSKRVFIPRSSLPSTANWTTTYPYTCYIDTAHKLNPVTDVPEVAERLIPLPTEFFPLSLLVGGPLPKSKNNPVGGQPDTMYTYTSRPCADCTARGVLKQPAFWK